VGYQGVGLLGCQFVHFSVPLHESVLEILEVGVLIADRNQVSGDFFLQIVPVANYQAKSEEFVVLQRVKDQEQQLLRNIV